jgi:hypothetical protein
MASRRWPRLLLACLLLWQLGTAVAMPHGTPTGHAGSAPAAHCADHAHAATDPAVPDRGTPTPPTPDCCQDLSTGCHCAQLPALTLATLDFGDVAPAGLTPAVPAARHVDARAADFFRPPI